MDESSAYRNEGEESNLTRIPGIDLAMQQWLQESLGILTWSDLSQASANAIEGQLNAEGHTTSRSEIEAWIAQARELTAETTAETKPELSGAIAADDFNSPSPASESPASVDWSPPTPVSNQQLFTPSASFTVTVQTREINGQIEYRTVAHHAETDEAMIWAGLEENHLQQWIFDQIHAQQQIEPTPQPRPTVEAATQNSPVIVEVDQLRVIQPCQTGLLMTAGKTNPVFPDFIKSGEPFELDVVFKLTRLSGSDQSGQQSRQKYTYSVQACTRQRSTGEVLYLGDVQANIWVADQSVYIASFSEVTIKQAGMYRLQVVVTLQNASVTPGYFEVPMLQVV